MGTNVLNDQWLTAAAVTRRCSEKEREYTINCVPFFGSCMHCSINFQCEQQCGDNNKESGARAK